MFDRIKRFIATILLSRFVVRLYTRELKVGIRDNIFNGNILVFMNTYHPDGKFEGVTALAALAKKYGLPVHVYTWYRHEEGFRHSYFVSSGVVIEQNYSEAVLRVARDLIESGRDKFVALAIGAPNAKFMTLHPITM